MTFDQITEPLDLRLADGLTQPSQRERTTYPLRSMSTQCDRPLKKNSFLMSFKITPRMTLPFVWREKVKTLIVQRLNAVKLLQS